MKNSSCLILILCGFVFLHGNHWSVSNLFWYMVCVREPIPHSFCPKLLGNCNVPSALFFPVTCYSSFDLDILSFHVYLLVTFYFIPLAYLPVWPLELMRPFHNLIIWYRSQVLSFRIFLAAKKKSMCNKPNSVI